MVKSRNMGFEAWNALLLRLVPGIVFFFSAVAKFSMGIGNVVGFVTESMSSTFLPGQLVTLYAYVLPFAELILGLGFILGYKRNIVYPLGGLLMLSIVFGVWLQQDYATTAYNTIHLFAIVGAMHFARADKLCLDRK